MSNEITFNTKNYGRLTLVPVTQAAVKQYLTRDPVWRMLKQLLGHTQSHFAGDLWLLESAVKRYIYHSLYFDLFSIKKSNQPTILDVGGGLTTIMKLLSRQCSYTLLDILTHEQIKPVSEFVRAHNIKLIRSSWHEVSPTKVYDIIFANDLFPNVDQRIDAFVQRFYPFCREMRLSLAVYPEDKFYATRRIGAEEVLYLKPWSQDELLWWLKKRFELVPKTVTLFPKSMYIYPNSRTVILLTLKH